MARDYKRRRSTTQRDAPGWVWMLFGLALGLSISLFVYFGERSGPAVPEPRDSEPASARAEAESADGTAGERAGRHYDFYEMLPSFEVVIPERETGARRDGRAATIEQPGAYVLQAGSFKNPVDADRMRATLAMQGLPSRIQKVSIDDDTWHRVRIGPISDLDELNRVRQRLHEARIDALTIRVAE